MSDIHNIVIVGAGPAGLYLSAFLKQRDIAHVLIEQAPKVANIGFGIIVQENLFFCLDRLGISRNDVTYATMREFEAYYGPTRKKMMDIHLDAIPFYALSRGELLRALKTKVDVKHILTGKRVESVRQTHDHYTIHFTDDTTLKARHVVGADGMRSVVRESLFRKHAVKRVYTGIYFWAHKRKEHTFVASGGPDSNLLLLPVNDNEEVLSIVTTLKCDTTRSNEEVCKAILETQGLEGKDLLTLIDFTKPSLVTPIRRTHPLRFVRGNAALIGDAAHGETPILGWGTTIAIEDAYILGSLIKNSPDNIERAFSEFYTERKERVALLHKITTLEERFLGILRKRENKVREIVLLLARPLDTVIYKTVRGLYRKLHAFTLTEGFDQ